MHCVAHGVAKSQTQLSDFHFHFSLLPEGFPVALAVKNPLAVKNAGDVRERGLIPGSEDPLEKEMATHSSILAWRIPWTEELGGLQSTGVAKSQTILKRLSMHSYPKNKKAWLAAKR